MSEAERTAPGNRQTTRFMLLYALAVAGGATAYIPLLTILLPVRVETLAAGDSVEWLAGFAFAGAIAASLANIAFGWLSDRTGNRTAWVFAGLVLSSALLVSMMWATDFATILALLVVWQLALNMMLGPLSAWAGDVVPDHQKGTLGGLLAFAPATGALAGTLITVPGLAGPDVRLVLVAVIVIACVLPVLLFGKPRAFPELMEPAQPTRSREPDGKRVLVARMWFARLLVQIAEAALFAYLYLWLRSIASGLGEDRAAQVFGLVLFSAVPLTLVVGRWADRADRPILPLGLAACITALALLAMAAAPGLAWALGAYAVFGLASSVFLALHTAQTLRVLPRPQSRGRDLGIFNLTNTMPSLIMPGMTLALVPVFGFDGLFVALAGLAGLAAILLLTARRPL